MEPVVFLFLLGSRLDELLFLDASLLTREVAQVEDAGAANLTDLVDFYFVDEGGLEGEDPFNSDTAGNFADSESPGEGSCTADLDDNASELLKSVLITFFDPVGHRHGVTGLERRNLSCFLVCKRLLDQFNQIHFSYFLAQRYELNQRTVRGCLFFGTANVGRIF